MKSSWMEGSQAVPAHETCAGWRGWGSPDQGGRGMCPRSGGSPCRAAAPSMEKGGPAGREHSACKGVRMPWLQRRRAGAAGGGARALRGQEVRVGGVGRTRG